jgi:hypothetical protein
MAPPKDIFVGYPQPGYIYISIHTPLTIITCVARALVITLNELSVFIPTHTTFGVNNSNNSDHEQRGDKRESHFVTEVCLSLIDIPACLFVTNTNHERPGSLTIELGVFPIPSELRLGLARNVDSSFSLCGWHS